MTELACYKSKERPQRAIGLYWGNVGQGDGKRKK